jgi:type IV pilus assembly protein PilB
MNSPAQQNQSNNDASSQASAPNLASTGLNGQGQSQSLAEILLTQGLISQGQFDDLKIEAAKTNSTIEELIKEKGMVDEIKFSQAKAQFLHVPFKSLAEIGASPEALNQVPETVAKRYGLMPFEIDKKDNTLSVGMVNPLDLKAIDFIEKKTGLRLVPHLITESDLNLALEERYAQSLGSEVSEALKDTTEPTNRTIDVTQLGEVIREAPIAKIVETLLTFALKARASDIHIEPQEEKTRIRYRIDGVLQEKLVLPLKVHDAVISRIKILARMKIDERRLPQDGRFSFRAGEDEVDLRVSSLPTVHGEKIVMRLLKKSGKVPTLSGLGLRGRALKNIENAILVPHGIILITGPTGSGKTTTLYSILNKINTPKVNIITLEDPVEYEIPGVNQVQVNPQAGLTFASGLRSFLRQDPNIIMVGEIRDTETAELAIQASLTGHLVFSTLHTNSAAGALPRLLDMEAEPFLLASSMTLVMAQRVVRKICEHCKAEYAPEQEVVEDIKKVLGSLYDGWIRTQNTTKNLVLYKGAGCVECDDTGYSGLIGIFEVMPISEKVSRFILERAPASKLESSAVEDGMVLMKQDGYIKVLEGITTIEEVIRVAEV